MLKIPDRAMHLGDGKLIVLLFHTSPSENTVTVAVGNQMATIPLWQFCRDMQAIAEEAGERG